MESILNRLSKIVENAPESFSDKGSVNWLSYRRGKSIIYLIGKNLDAYNSLLRNLLIDEKWSEKFSEKYVDNVLQDGIFNILNYGIEKAAESFLETCNEVETYSIEQTVYIPLSGISMYDIEEFCLGMIKFKRITRKALEEILEAIQAVLKENKTLSEEQKFFIQAIDESLSSELSEKICAVYQIIAEPTRARELAEQEIQLALDLLRYSIPILHRDEEFVRIDLSSQPSFLLALILSSGSFQENWRSSNHNYEISPSNLRILEEIGVFKVSDLLKQPKLNDFENMLLRGIHWFASSQIQAKKENEFLNLVTCLEVFFTQKGGEPISTSIAEGIALVLGSDLAERKRLKSRVKKLYGNRSEVSHGGHVAILDQDCIELKFIAMDLLREMIQLKETFNSRKMLTEWLEDKRLS